MSSDLVFLLDVDNTLLDNDRLKNDLDLQMQRLLGPEETRRFWQVYEEVRRQEDYVDYPASIRRWSDLYGSPELARRLDEMIAAIDFRSYVFPGAFETIRHLRRFGTSVILSDGDTVFQPMKIRLSGLDDAVDGNVLIYVHKELELRHVFARYPARHYVIVDDKPRILAILERECPVLFTTILVLQGKYAVEGQYQPAPDYTVDAISDLRKLTKRQFVEPALRHHQPVSS